MNCPRCKKPTLRIMGQAVVNAPASMLHQFSKKNLRSKDVWLQGVLWETFSKFCEDATCGYHADRLGNYVTKLEDENAALKAELAVLKGKK